MASAKDRPISHLQDFQNMFDTHFRQPTPKNDTREEMTQEARGKGKKRRDDEG